MKTITTMLAIVLAALYLTACSQEPPAEKTAQPAVQTAQPAPAPTQQLADKTEKKLQDMSGAAKQDAEKAVEMVKQEGSAAAEQVKSATADAVKKTTEVVTPVKPDQTSAAPAQPTAEAPKPAVAAAATGPGTVVYEASMGKVTYNHAEHAGRLDCSECHTTDPPQKIVINKDVAHNQLCKACHKKSGGNAPTGCLDCHKK